MNATTPAPTQPTGQLFYGDNLAVLRESIATESVDLIYLDPPFNSNATYNVLFRSPAGAESQAQIEAFEDTWHWGQEAEGAFDQVMRSGNTNAADMLRAVRSFLGENRYYGAATPHGNARVVSANFCRYARLPGLDATASLPALFPACGRAIYGGSCPLPSPSC